MSLDDAALAPWVALSLIPGVGWRLLARLRNHFGSVEAVLDASQADLRQVKGIGVKLSAAIGAVDLPHTRQEMSAWRADGIDILFHGADDYPALLRTLDDPPPILFRRGTALPQDERAVALVGTRRPSPESRRLAGDLAALLAGHGWTVVSGLALGIDTAAHQGALHGGGRTLAVLGCGVRVVYPPENAALGAEIGRGGALFSEVHPDAAPASPALVARNRLISGLSRAVIVVETSEQGGSLHAARFAQTQGRAVYAVQNSAGGNRQLIESGARPVMSDPASWPRLVQELELL